MPLSVIIPTLDEENCLAETLCSVRRQRPLEIIVADGGSRDATPAIAAELADRLVQGASGRAAQMNRGARHATGDLLLFLHADCTLDDGALAEAARWLRRPRVAAGCFRMRVRAEGPLYRSIDACATGRVYLMGLVYGNQGLFVRRSDFERIGGFPPLRLMEDVYISKRLRQLGRVVVARRRIHVSPRRWQRAGLVRQTLRNWTLTTLAAAGVHPDRLAASYPTVR